MTRRELISEVQKLRRPGDPLVPFEKAVLEARLKEYQEREFPQTCQACGNIMGLCICEPQEGQ